MYSFITSGNFIIFKYTEENDLLQLREEHEVFKLHNTSKCIDWGLTEDTTKITFTIDELRYENILLSSIEFDGVVCETQQDFIDGLQGMFENLAGGGSSPGGSSYLVAEVELDNDDILGLVALSDGGGFIELLSDIGGNRIPIILGGVLIKDFTNGGYGNVQGTDSYFNLVYTKNGVVINDACFFYGDARMSFFTSATSGFAQFPPRYFPDVDEQYISATLEFNQTSDYVGSGLGVFCYNNGMGNFNAGGVGNSLKIILYYKIQDL